MAKQQWTENETKRLLRLKRNGVTIDEIAHILGRSRGSISCKITDITRKQKLGYWSNGELVIRQPSLCWECDDHEFRKCEWIKTNTPQAFMRIRNGIVIKCKNYKGGD